MYRLKILTITVLANLTCRGIQGYEIIAIIYNTLSTLPYFMIIGDIHTYVNLQANEVISE